MSAEPRHFLSLHELADCLRRRSITSVEVTKAQFARIEQLDLKLRSFATVATEHALAEAAARDVEASTGRFLGPLHGVPIAVKDLCDTAGIPTTAGMPIFRDNIPETDATVVSRLRAAGAVILGKLQMTEGAYGAHHPSIQAPLNPWSEAYWTGFSSSGSGVATAAGLCFASLGSDTGGSIRFPSSMNGITGLKPTWGRVSRAGVFPLAESLDHVGPMARSALDCAIMLGVIAGADPKDPTAALHPVPDYAGMIGTGAAGKRFGLPKGLTDLDADAQSCLAGAASALAKAGATIIDVDLPSEFAQASRDWASLCGAETALAHEATYPGRRPEYGPALTELIELGRRTTGVELARLNVRRAALTGALNTMMMSIDLLLMPVMMTAAWKLADLAALGRDPAALAGRLRYTAPFDMSGHPTLTLPGGMTAAGIPTGFQIVGRAFDEASILAAGHTYQQMTDWHLKRPPL